MEKDLESHTALFLNVLSAPLNIIHYHQSHGSGGSWRPGLNTNAGAGGKTLIIITSWHWDGGTNTGSKVDMIKFPYSGNSFEVTNIARNASNGDYDPSYDEYYGNFSVECKCETKITIVYT